MDNLKLSRYGVLSGVRARLHCALENTRYAILGMRMTPERSAEYQQMQAILAGWIDTVEHEMVQIAMHLTTRPPDPPVAEGERRDE